MKSNLEMERIFSVAVGLDQSGRTKNEIYCGDSNIFIFNSDRTILLKFSPSQIKFDSPISFFASDFEGINFKEKNGRISFVSKSKGFQREKVCAVPKKSFVSIRETFGSFSRPKKGSEFVLNISVLGLLDENLSHVEFVSDDGNISLLQRDLFNGSLISLTRKEEGIGVGHFKKDNLSLNFTSFGVRTNDLLALFAFNQNLSFFKGDKTNYVLVSGKNMEGILSLCLYDDLGEIGYLMEENNGGKEQESRNSKQATDRPTQKRRLSRK